MQKITITIEQDGSKPVIFGIDQTEEDKPTAESILAEADGQEHTGNEQPKKTTAAQQQRYNIASDLANVCEYMTDAEAMKVKLIIKECEGRVKR